ncbi:endonuclease/exonuclease/phosphatase family protein [Actinoplanes sp. NPDC024001]|uniref:endonuclease/exonuclease/phosphatase family protein n=1 Tax=Actinoplanes sp. NPDC024001 TaxID=3154598 RepID=UPI0033F1E408
MLLRVAVPLAVLVTALMLLHGLVPNRLGHLGSLVEAFRPWLGLGVPVLLALALWRRSVAILLTALLPLAVWAVVFGGQVFPTTGKGSSLTAVQHNVSDENPDPAGTVRTLVEGKPDLVGLQEVTPEALPAYAAAFGADYPHHTVQGTVALWSRHPLREARALDIRPAAFGADWNRGLRAVAQTPIGDIAVYVAHLPSVRLGLGGFDCLRRDESARKLAAAVGAEPVDRVVLLGDLNSTIDDRGLAPVTGLLATGRSTFPFSWPATLPVARVDQIMVRSMTVPELWSLERTGSDHLPIAATLDL